jgi:hypothetical protein
MFNAKNTENIYGYTGKKSSNFVLNRNQVNKEIPKIKNIIIKNEEIINENIIKKFCIKTDIENLEIEGIDIDIIYNNINEFLNKSFYIKDEDLLIEFILLNHEKGISVKCNHFDYKFNLQLDGEYEEIIITKNLNQNVCNSKISFINPNFPFHYIYEDNPLCDAIFNDYIKTLLPEIKSPNNYLLPVKITNNLISFRQYIGYIKTFGFLNFKINEKGWYLYSFTNDNDDLNVNGVDVKYKNFWIYHPRCSRIEHQFIFQ